MKTILTTLILFHNFLTFAQGFTFQCDSLKVDYYNSISENSELVHSCPTIPIDTSQIPDNFLKNVQNYLIERVGSTFYSRLSFEDARAIDTIHDDSWWTDKPWLDKRNVKKLKYSFRYSFTVQDSMKYYFSVSFDKKSRRTSPHYLPSVKQINDFDKKIHTCNAIAIANMDKIFSGQADFIDFEYYPKTNSFMWVIEKPDIKIDEENVITRQILIDINSGNIVKRRELKGIIVKPSTL
ncbi:MAG: hypothetical protein ACK44D_04365 [Bacteroidia bacterium]